jgi:hypothetical protein
MRIRWYVVPTFAVAMAGMALSGCSDPGTTSTPESTKSASASSEKTAEPASDDDDKSEDATTTASFTEAVEYDDGVKVEVSKIEHGKIGQYASGGKPGGDKTMFTIRITNKSKEAFDPALAIPSVTYGEAGTNADTVFDVDDDSADTSVGFQGKILPGKSMSATWAFAIPKAELGNVTLQLPVDVLGKEPAIFTGSAK